MPTLDIARQKDAVVTATADTPVGDIAKTMANKSVGSVVIHQNEEPIGIVTDRDIAVKVVAEGKDPKTTTANDVMEKNIVSVDANTGVRELCAKMKEHSVRRMPVTENGKLAGFVTLDDLVVLIDQEMTDLSEVIKTESPPY
ncbi:CBS domain-containing protein [Haloarchaeobius sp. HME9146]|uniref:CBS domain-containing protein n=1 Tax=Haloarchaeobius sp. HME9146 TaxID=2978732 RepID=UPI0021C100DE|nr:CBS domain-containing protein [Haloarchaeobius sp. HME9146]MCT9096016.1 CBS domain-containing protein [Haloarchaeobius sp. HME9146]